LNNTTKGDDDRLKSGGGDRQAVEGGRHDETLQLFAEELSIAKETLEIGRVRVATRTHEREALVDENLARERVEVETVPIGRRIDAMPEVRQEGDTTIVPVVEELLHIERQLMLKEEVRIKRLHTTERYQEKVTLRHQEAVITRHEDNKESEKKESDKKESEKEDNKGPQR
jgi:uncharacterized protein (TIGR02271 family)